jgi:hypothetical protein
MKCSDIGDFAAAVVVGKENGQSLEDALEKVRKRTAGYPVERKNLTQIVHAIYTEPWAIHLSEEGARQSFTADCEAQWTAPTGGNTEQNRNSVDTSYQIYVPREEYRKLEELQKEHERLAEDARKAMAHYRSLSKEDKKKRIKPPKRRMNFQELHLHLPQNQNRSAVPGNTKLVQQVSPFILHDRYRQGTQEKAGLRIGERHGCSAMGAMNKYLCITASIDAKSKSAWNRNSEAKRK